MKITTVLSLLCLSAVHAQSTDMELDASSNGVETTDGSYLRRQAKAVTNSAVDTTTSRVIVEFANKEGKQHAIALATTVYDSVSTGSHVVMDIENDLISQLEQDSSIVSVDHDSPYNEQGFREELVGPDDPRFRKLSQTTPYGITMVQADQLDVGKKPVRVCIADTGASITHPDLPFKIMRGSNRIGSITGTKLKWRVDKRGHGTHVSGTISAVDNGFGVRGIGRIPLYITRALDDLGQARESDIIQALEECGNSGAKVISLSLAGGGMGSTLTNLLTSLYQDKGILIFAASGNNGQNSELYPAGHPLVVAVGAVQQDDTIWPSSNYGSWLEVTAPGKMIYSTTVDSLGNNIYAYYSGTSMATPHAAGVAALVWSHFPECTNTQIRYALVQSSMDLGSAGCDNYFGYGVVQAKNAVDWLTAHPCKGATWGQGTVNGGCTLLSGLSK